MVEEKGSPAGNTTAGKDGTFVTVDQKSRSTNNTPAWVIKFQNIHTPAVLWYVNRNPGCTIGECQDGLGYTLTGSRQNWIIRKQINDVFEVLLLAGYLIKTYHRFYPTRKSENVDNRVKLNADGLPIAQNFKSRFAFEDTHIPIGPRIRRDTE